MKISGGRAIKMTYSKNWKRFKNFNAFLSEYIRYIMLTYYILKHDLQGCLYRVINIIN